MGLLELFTELIDRHGVQRAAIITGNHVKVMSYHPIFRAFNPVQTDQFDRGIGIQFLLHQHAGGGQLGPAVTQLQCRAQQGLGGDGIGHPGRVGDVVSQLPFMLMKIVGDAADGIHRLEQVALVVTVEIDGIVAVAGGYELAHAHGTGVGAFLLIQRPALFFGQLQVIGELRTEELAPGRIMKTQGVQRIQHLVAAHVGAIEGFDPDDGGDDLCRHLQFLFGPGQQFGVLLPERQTLLQPLVGQKDGPVLMPGLGLCRPRHGIDNRLLISGLRHGIVQLGDGKFELAGQLVEPLLLLRIKLRGRYRGGQQQGGRKKS